MVDNWRFDEIAANAPDAKTRPPRPKGSKVEAS
jgi:hypothetical protein